MKRLPLALLVCILAACIKVQDDPSGFRVVFEDKDAARLAVCGTSGRAVEYITPDSLSSSGPVTDSTHATVYFLAKRKSVPDDLQGIYSIHADGSELKRISDIPLSALDMQVTPDGATLVFTGKYPDEEHIRAYQMRTGESGFHAITPPEKSAYDPAMAPGGLNFVWNDGTRSDTLFVSSLQEFLTLPIFPFKYTQVALSWPYGREFAAIGGAHRRGLYLNVLQSPEGQEVRRESVLIPEMEGVAYSQPTFHPDGARILFVRVDEASGGETELQVINRNSLEITSIPIACRHPAHPAWVR